MPLHVNSTIMNGGVRLRTGFPAYRTWWVKKCYREEWDQDFLNPFLSILPQLFRLKSLSIFPLMDMSMTRGW